MQEGPGTVLRSAIPRSPRWLRSVHSNANPQWNDGRDVPKIRILVIHKQKKNYGNDIKGSKISLAYFKVSN